MGFVQINSDEFSDNPFKRIGRDWMLVTAGNEETGVNMLTACWGGLGNLWHKDAAFIFIRPSRHTFQFIEENERFTLSFFEIPMYRKMLGYMGSHSGKDGDKAEATGLHIRYFDGAPAYEEANLVLVCRKMAYVDFVPEQIPDVEIKRFYSGEEEGDFHRAYAGEVIGIYRKE